MFPIHSPVNVLQDLARMPSIKFRAEILTGRYLRKTYQIRSHLLIPKLQFKERLDQKKKKISDRNLSFLLKTWKYIKGKLTKFKKTDNYLCF